MKVALAQIDCSVGDVEANCAKITDFTEKASGKGCEVVIFPEMSDTGYDTSVIKHTASSWDERPFSIIQNAAVKHSIYVVCGLSERVENDVYNSVAILSPEGKLLGSYRKMHLFSPKPAHEDQCFTHGSSFTILSIGDFTWGFTICYDLRFPELYRVLALKGADVFVNCSAWPIIRAVRWEVLTKARAIENEAYMLGVNRVGVDGGVELCGSSCIVDPFGTDIALGSTDQEELVISEVESEKITAARKSIRIFEDRRADLYGNLGI